MSKKHYAVRFPRYAAGIRAQETRSGSARSWWARKWTQILEGMNLGTRLGRGRNYAVTGQVVSLEIAEGRLLAKVQGTRPDPYEISVDFRKPEGEVRARIVAKLRAEPMLVARLLVDDLPTEIEDFFAAEGLTLFPGGKLGPGKYDMTTHCSCPDYANPCKHTSAVLYILGEAIARRPATLLALRGIPLEDLYDED